jgi:hypothetical protein
MATTAAPTRSNGRTGVGAARPVAERPSAARRRQLPLVVVGVLLVVGCALVFADISLRTGRGQEVLVVSEPVAAGQLVTAGDLRAVKLSATGGVASVPAGDEQAVVGQPAAVPLAAGSVLTRADVGASAGVGADFDVVAVALKPGAYPPDLAAGARVQVIPVASSSSSSSSSSSGPGSTAATGSGPVGATVLSVEAPSATSGSPAVVSLEVARSDADEVASLAASGEVALVEEGSGG